jgi:hypothetical protein
MEKTILGKRDIYYTLPWLMRGWLMSIIEGYGLRIGAELGVFRGDTTFFLLDHAPELTLYAVDLFERQEGHACYDSPRAYVDGRVVSLSFDDINSYFMTEASRYGERLIVKKGWTHEVADEVEDGSLHFVFIDADHSYECVKRDILAWRPKVCAGGFLMGHDTHMEGVRRAVMECLDNYEVSFDTFCWIEQV